MAERLTIIFKIYNYHFATSYELNSIKFYSHSRAQSTNKNLDDPVLEFIILCTRKQVFEVLKKKIKKLPTLTHK